MQTEEYDGKQERAVVIGCIVSDTVLAKLAARDLAPFPFAGHESNDVLSLCRRYFRKHGRAPLRDFDKLVYAWAERQHDPERIRLMQEFVAGLSGEYEQLRQEINPSFILDLADRCLNKVKLRSLLHDAEAQLQQGNLDEAWQTITAARRIPLADDSRVPLFGDREEVFACFAEHIDPIIHYPQALGQFFADTLARDNLVSFVAPEKSGKTFWLLDVAFRAIQQRRKTVFFEVGDMSRYQIERRFLARLARHPFRNDTGKWPYQLDYPTAIQPPHAPGAVAVVSHEPRTFSEPLNGQIAWQACEEFRQHYTRSYEEYFYIETHPHSTVTVAAISAKLADWALDGWVADVVCIDYADILAAPQGTKRFDRRDQIHGIWAELRRLSQERHCLVVTATQANAKSYEQDRLLDRRCFSEDKRKNAEAVGMIGINVSSEDKKAGCGKLNWVFKREGDFNSQVPLHVASCLPLAHPSVCACW